MQKTRREVRNFIGGEWVDGNGRETEPVTTRPPARP